MKSCSLDALGRLGPRGNRRFEEIGVRVVVWESVAGTRD